MPFAVAPLTADTDFDEFVQAEWAAYEQPLTPLLRLFFPILGQGAEARASSMKESVERQRTWQRTDPTGSWIKAVDTETGAIVGGACWHHYKVNPYAEEGDHECTWFPEGEPREIANALMAQYVRPRLKYMARPHSYLEICFVHPDYRRKGIGKLLVKWG